MQKAEMAPGVERDTAADSEAAKRQAVASPCDCRGALQRWLWDPLCPAGPVFG